MIGEFLHVADKKNNMFYRRPVLILGEKTELADKKK